MIKKPAFYKVLLVCLAVMTVSIMTINYIYNTIHREHWTEQNEAIKVAYEQSELVRATHVEPFTFEGSYTIVFGEDANGEELIVWVAMDEGDEWDVQDPVQGPVDEGIEMDANDEIKNGLDSVGDAVYGESVPNIDVGEIEGMSRGEEPSITTGVRVVHSAYAADGVNQNLLKLKMRELEPNLHIIKMTPGKYRHDWVWEVNYKKSEKEKRTYYSYYRFSDGTLLKTLTMSVK